MPPLPTPPLKSANFIFIVVSLSLTVVADPIAQDNGKRERERSFSNTYGNSLSNCTEKGDKDFPILIYFVAILSNWVPDNWAYRLPRIETFIACTACDSRKMRKTCAEALSGPLSHLSPKIVRKLCAHNFCTIFAQKRGLAHNFCTFF